MDFQQFEEKSVLIIGGAGFVGSNLAKMLLRQAKNPHITVVDNLLSSESYNLPQDDRLRFWEGSITSDNILAQIKDEYDYVFHLATYHGNQSSIHNPLADHENNTYTTLKLYEHLKEFKKIQKIVYSSAGCSVAKKTFDDAEETTEDAGIEVKQDSPYSISKIIGEFYSVYYHKQHNLPTVRARFQNVYGEGEILGAGQWRGTPATVWRNVTPVFVYKALKNMPMPLENEGIATRDFIYVEDICRGLLACALYGQAGDVYNLASGNQTTIAQLAQLIVKLTDSKAVIEYLPKRSWDNSGKRYGSTQKSKKILSFEAKVSIEEGLKKTIDWTIQNLTLIESSIKKHNAYLKID